MLCFCFCVVSFAAVVGVVLLVVACLPLLRGRVLMLLIVFRQLSPASHASQRPTSTHFACHDVTLSVISVFSVRVSECVFQRSLTSRSVKQVVDPSWYPS